MPDGKWRWRVARERRTGGGGSELASISRPDARIPPLRGAGKAVVAIVLLGCVSFAAPAAPAAPRPIPHDQLTGTWVSYRPHRFPANHKYTGAVPAPDTPPPPLRPRYLVAWRARQKAVQEANRRGEPLYNGYAACLPDGMPAMMMAMFPMDVLQTPGQITIIEEAFRQVRYIYLDQKQVRIDDAEPGFWGHSVGHWDGDTLVVNTVGIRPEVRFRDVPHSARMQINERIRLLSPDMFRDHITVVDPVYLARPWSFTVRYQRRPGYKMLEYVCESNRVYDDPKTGGQDMKLFTIPPKTAKH